jgi:hypothetical protein
VHSVCILDANTFETLHVYELGQGENGMSLISTTLGDETTPLYTVGTGITSPDDIECKQVWRDENLLSIYTCVFSGPFTNFPSLTRS